MIIVHPFYTLFRHCNLLLRYNDDCDYLKIYKAYEKKIFNVLGTDRYNIIMFETPDAFAMYTKKFLVNPFIRKVVFTNHSHEIPLPQKKLSIPNDNRILICGCYIGDCIDEVIKSIKDKKIKNDICILEDYSLKRPQ